MLITRDASEDEVILEFLRAEIDSPRFSDGVVKGLEAVGVDRTLIDHATLDDESANASRRHVLELARSWKSGGDLFLGFPQDIRWFLARLDAKEVDRILYIDARDLLEASGRTRLPAEAARRIRTRENPWAHLYDGLDGSDHDFTHPRIILVGEDDGSKLVLVEGHFRMTALHLCDAVPPELEVFLGTSARLDEWSLY